MKVRKGPHKCSYIWSMLLSWSVTRRVALLISSVSGRNCELSKSTRGLAIFLAVKFRARGVSISAPQNCKSTQQVAFAEDPPKILKVTMIKYRFDLAHVFEMLPESRVLIENTEKNIGMNEWKDILLIEDGNGFFINLLAATRNSAMLGKP